VAEAAPVVSCPANPPAPAGYQVWKGDVPPELAQWAVQLLGGVGAVPYWTVWTLPYSGGTVAARKDYHTWTWRNGTLITGICIPGITLYKALPQGAITTALAGDPLANPDGTEAVFGQSTVTPPSSSSSGVGAFAGGLLLGGALAEAARLFFRR
jgi:hypothetical protein